MMKVLVIVLCGSLLLAACSPQSTNEFSPAANTQEVQPPTHEPIKITTITTSPSVSTPVSADQSSTPSATFQAVAISTSTPEPMSQESAPSASPMIADTRSIIIDHTSVALFDQIPEDYITAARNLQVMFSDRSVGQNINESLDCLTAPSWDQSPPYCRTDYYDSSWNWKLYKSSDLSNNAVPSRILFDPDPSKYNRDNWTFEFRGGGWSNLTQDFIHSLAPSYIDSKAVLTYQFTYLNVTDRDDIADSEKGFFANNPNKFDINDLEDFIAQNPDKIFIFWTTSLARSIGTQVSTDFNNQMRLYAIEHNKILFDVADIESHTDQGAPCYDNRDGVQYCSKQGKCENFPDDGKNFPAICQDYTTETEGGHLGSVSGGGIRIAKAFWVLMARIAGWDGKSTGAP